MIINRIFQQFAKRVGFEIRWFLVCYLEGHGSSGPEVPMNLSMVRTNLKASVVASECNMCMVISFLQGIDNICLLFHVLGDYPMQKIFGIRRRNHSSIPLPGFVLV
jgi:hypothetical protein